MESFFSSLKNELTRHRYFQHHAEARYAIAEYIEVFNNGQRYTRRLAIGVRRNLNGREVAFNSRVCFFGATSTRPQYLPCHSVGLKRYPIS